MSTTTVEPSGPAGTPPERTGLSPRKRRRISLGIQYAIGLVVLVALVIVIDWGQVGEHFFDPDEIVKLFPNIFLIAMKNTVIYTVSAYVVGFALGLVVALMRLSSVKIYRWIALVYVEIFRGLPALLVLMIIGFGLPMALGVQMPFDIYGKVAIGLGLAASAYMAETFRAGIEAVPKGQVEAARSLGMSQSRAMVTIVVPQALRIVIPPLTNELVLLFKDSSLVSALGITAATVELTKFGSDMGITAGDTTPMIVAGMSYLVITVPLGIAVRKLEARQRKGR
ncbi:amino acid ABC transporter permease [Bailinhaonella thermotolerans]|uniref:Amino acid ABC transporter permease n=1 Tax=Bailinhaonella thermotolerans TaxID=1070861 RepID=A0A3A4A983_9ACTN|nr:amino acid ABC transporter permease [Bailinhaonella thermotolerans]RJL25165.1 amino acid ABC transporter permease [Bailinhaonella thermotolerans]